MRQPIIQLALAGSLFAAAAWAQPEQPPAEPEPEAEEAAGGGQPEEPEPPAEPPKVEKPVEAKKPPAKRALVKKAAPAKAPAEKQEPEVVQLLPGHAVSRHIFPEEKRPKFDPDKPWVPAFAMHGYFRAPLRLTLAERPNPEEGQSDTNIREPWLVDDDYFRSGFSYTPVNETDFAEVYFMVGNKYLTANVALMASLFSDSARVLLDAQLGIAQAWVTFHHEIDLDPVTLRLEAKGGSFWERFGWLPKYDTYIFARTHQIGEMTKAELDIWKLTFSVQQGFGAHKDAIEANQGFAPLFYFRTSAAYDRLVEVGFHYFRTWTQDQRQLGDVRDASMRVHGIDARGDAKFLGDAYLAISAVKARKASFLAPSLEVMHAYGGRGITENYLGTESSNDGNGHMLNVGFQYDFSAAKLLDWLDLQFPLDGNVTLSLFGLYADVDSDQKSEDPAVNRDERKYWKQGMEFNYWVLPWIGGSIRYDRVVPDLDDEPSSFRIVSPRVSLRGSYWGIDGLLFYQFSHYLYGERVGLRSGQVPNETLPDNNVHKIQGQISF